MRRSEKWEAYSFVEIAGILEGHLRVAANAPGPRKASLKQARLWAELFQTKFEKLTQ